MLRKKLRNADFGCNSRRLLLRPLAKHRKWLFRLDLRRLVPLAGGGQSPAAAACLSQPSDQINHRDLVYRWQKEFFENAAAAFEPRARRAGDAQDRRIALLEQ